MKAPKTKPAAERDATAAAARTLIDREADSPMLRWLVHLGGPVSISIAIHLLVFGLLAWGTWGAVTRSPREKTYEVSLAPIAEQPPGLRWPGAFEPTDTEDTSEANPFEHDSFTDLAQLATEPPPNAGQRSTGGFDLGDSGLSGVLGIGGGAGAGGGANFGEGFGTSDGFAGVWQLRARGNLFVYVIDFSGSIIPVENALRRELKRSIGQLKPHQSFNVILFYGGLDRSSRRTRSIAHSFTPKLQKASAGAKRKFFNWIEARRPQGASDPLPAIRRALAMRPDAIFVFSDGLFDDPQSEQQIDEANLAGTQIHCLAFDELLLDDYSDTPRLSEGGRRLQRLSQQSGGKFKVVTGKDLDQ